MSSRAPLITNLKKSDDITLRIAESEDSHTSAFHSQKMYETETDPTKAEKGTSVQLAEVTEAIMKLRMEHREVLFLICIRGMRYHEVAAALKIPLSTLIFRLHEARETLHKRMSDPPASEYENIPLFFYHEKSQTSKGRQ